MFISKENYEKLLEAYNNCLSNSLVPSEYIELSDVVGDCLNEIEEYENSNEDGEPDLEQQELEDYCQDGYFENMECGEDGYWYG